MDSNSRHQGPFKTHDVPAHSKKPSSLWPLQVGLSPGNLCLLWDQGTTPVTGIVPICPLCLDSQAGAVSMVTKGGLGLPLSFSLNLPQGSWVKGGEKEGFHWSSILELLIAIRENDISFPNKLFRRQAHGNGMFSGTKNQYIWVEVLVLQFTHCVVLSKSFLHSMTHFFGFFIKEEERKDDMDFV